MCQMIGAAGTHPACRATGNQPLTIDDRAREAIEGATRRLSGATYLDTKELAATVKASTVPGLKETVERQLTAVQRGEFAQETDRLTNGNQWGVNQILGANGDFLRNYNNMIEANTIGADKYFHCKANFEASARGENGENRARFISDTREFVDQTIKGDPASASAADQVANEAGRNMGSLYPSMMGREACDKFRPNGLDARY